MNWVGMKIDQGPVKSPSPPFSKGGPGGILQEKGYTLIEVLIAITVLAFGLMAVATMQVTAIKTNAIASGISQGLTLAQARVEELMNLPYGHDDLKDFDGDGTGKDLDNDGVDDNEDNFGLNHTEGEADNSTPETNDGYTIYWNVAINVPVIDSKTIRVIVTWTEKGRNKRIKLDFVKTNLS
jgi:type IV pilus assembly protein PilV